MAKVIYKNGVTSVILRVKILDSSKSDGSGLTGLAYNSTGLVISTIADNEASAAMYTQAAGNIENITTLGTFAAPTAGKCRFKEVDSTNHPGLYEIQVADARWAVSAARSIIVSVHGAANAAGVDAEIQLTAVDLNDAASGGMSNLNLDAIADRVLSRDVSDVEDTANDHSLCYVILAMSESNTVDHAGKLTVYKTDGLTEFVQKTLTVNADADPITGLE